MIACWKGNVTGMVWVRVILGASLAVALPGAQDSAYERARHLYQQTEYPAALTLLEQSGSLRTAPAYQLAGQCAYMSGDFKKAVELFEKAVQSNPAQAEHQHWLGRAWGRRAETSNPLAAPAYASRARQAFEKAVDLDPRNFEAINDLFSFYLDAPGFLGGGIGKAQGLIGKIQANDPAEVHYALAQIAMKRKQYDAAEGQLKRAVELAPRQIGRLVDLAKFLASRGKYPESEAMFEAAARLNPADPTLLYGRAQSYIETRRNLDAARQLLEKYLKQPLTPDQPAREEAQKLLKTVSGG